MVMSLWPRFWPTLYVYFCGWIRPICGYNFDFALLKELAFNRKRTEARFVFQLTNNVARGTNFAIKAVLNTRPALT